MVKLSYGTFHTFVEEELGRVEVPRGGQERRAGALEWADDVIKRARQNLSDVDDLYSEGSSSARDAAGQVTEITLELGSFLYAAGTDHPVWRRWIGLAALGIYLTVATPARSLADLQTLYPLRDVHEAAQYAALGGEWRLLGALPLARPSTLQDRVLGELARLESEPSGRQESNSKARSGLGNTHDDEERAWLRLAVNIPTGDHQATEQALKELADFWMGEGEDDWMRFHRGSYPDFEAPACAVAAIARHHGFAPSSMTPEQRAFLEPGLATPEPAPLYPKYFDLP
ncbi:MAG TPA: hypothetical protein VEY08_14195, partial [Chloroflexia bacterium]|nr:hypothetical protein [Chloroflexia bacterium]